MNDLNIKFCAKSISKYSLPEKNGQFVFIDNCYLALDLVLEIFRKEFKFEKFILIRCLVNKRVCIRFIFFCDKNISSECKVYYKDRDYETRNVVSIWQGLIKPNYHNRAKYVIVKAFCDSYIGMNKENLICSMCCSLDVRSTINTYFCWRFDYKREVLRLERERNKNKEILSFREAIKESLNGNDFLEWGTHHFDIEDVNIQMEIVNVFFEKMFLFEERLLWGDN